MADIKKVATRESYGNALKECGAKYDILVLDADLSKSTKTDVFKKAYPERFINCGIAEANMMCTAAGLASCGRTVFASSFAMFAAGRAFEQIRNSICYPNLPVKIVASHAGITVGEDGATHQCLEDLAIMRSLPNMVVINPADDTETKKAVEAAINYNGPVYIRVGRAAVPVVFDESYNFEIGKGVTVKDGNDITLIGTGIMVNEAMVAAEKLAEKGISARVINIATLKPIDKDIIIKAAKETKGIVTCEEHNINGGLGSAVAEVLCENAPAKMARIGTKDVFGASGKPAELMDAYEISADHIVKAAEELLK
ncbi:MAG: transketolase family protein [Clostridia bacterium]|nr:transketolase family protein [Clostridia bacterium]